jgi:hypothetical protein
MELEPEPVNIKRLNQKIITSIYKYVLHNTVYR